MAKTSGNRFPYATVVFSALAAGGFGSRSLVALERGEVRVPFVQEALTPAGAPVWFYVTVAGMLLFAVLCVCVIVGELYEYWRARRAV